ncbi:hypothetical protein DEU56DRAFT_758783 [Suillus clintonianus]|uniref:uncharacterized protein n=1 Tax=Suillus clintonianus TaxID=1904413 RepID=UPI001B87A146|nr:uncharacterized protein DEU56DRAFT_758783 [Suillus clintonianus]KAG2126799.1 hypothetical protein DEU56DRAFT_758783 [Suillus clintonianus]
MAAAFLRVNILNDGSCQHASSPSLHSSLGIMCLSRQPLLTYFSRLGTFYPRKTHRHLPHPIPRPTSIQKPSALPVRTNLSDMSKTETSLVIRLSVFQPTLNEGVDASFDWDITQDMARLKLGAVGDLIDDIRADWGFHLSPS